MIKSTTKKSYKKVPTSILLISLFLFMQNTLANQEDVEEKVAPNSFIKSNKAIDGEYIVVFNETKGKLSAKDTDFKAKNFSQKHSVNPKHIYRNSIKGFTITTNEAKARLIANEPDVAYVVENSMVYANEIQNDAPWGLDRLDQRTLPLNSTYNYSNNSTGVHAYVIDSGINTAHVEFGGRASKDFSSVQDAYGLDDCNGHGTHVAGIIGAKTYGVAKNVNLHSVRVLNCAGSASVAGVIAGIDWVTANAIRPAVANMSLGGSANLALDNAVKASINSGIVYTVAAGNENTNACYSSPARTFSALTVGATTNLDARASYSNYGKCVDIFAPGSSITSTWIGSTTTTNTISGTSMASPHVAGVVATYLQKNPTSNVTNTINAVMAQLTTDTNITNSGSGSPKLLASTIPGNFNALFHYFNSVNNANLYTSSWQELNAGIQSWSYKGIMGYLYPKASSNGSALHRYLNTKNSDSIYTINFSELGNGNSTWRYEGITGYCATSSDTNTKDLHRYYNSRIGKHFFTSNWNELQGGANGYAYEGITCKLHATQ